jgi:hypothetical protein
MADFARTIGMPDNQINSSIAWLDSHGTASADPTGASAAPDHAAIERSVAKQDADRYEKMMRERPGGYWGFEENQQRYREALDRSTPPAPTEWPVALAAPAVAASAGVEPAVAPAVSVSASAVSVAPAEARPGA